MALVAQVAQRYESEVRKVDAWTLEESEALLERARESEPNLYPLLLCLLHTGMRRGEAIALKWEDVNFSGGVLTVRRSRSRGKDKRPKNGKARELPLSDDLRRELEHLAETRRVREGPWTDPGYVFLSPTGRMTHERNVNRAFY